LIQSNARPTALSDFYMIRGRAFNAKQDYDHALGNLNEAIHSNPQSVAALQQFSFWHFEALDGFWTGERVDAIAAI